MRAAERGFSLVEVLIGTGLLAGALVSLAHLVTICTSTNAAAHHRTMAALFAQQKLEELRSEPVLAGESRATEYLDAAGAIVCGGPALCAGAVYFRQWSVHQPAIVPPALLVHVRARALRTGGDVDVVTVRPGTGW